MKNTLDTLILPTSARCLCGVFHATPQERKDGLCATCADAPCCYAVTDDYCEARERERDAQERAREAARLTLLPCGYYPDACHCGNYPTAAQWRAMQAEAETALPEREALTVAEEIEAEELRNFFGRRQDA